MSKASKEKILRKMLNNKDLMNQLELALKLDNNVKISKLVFETKNYDGIDKLKGNRVIDKNNLKKITKSIEKNGYKKSQPVTIDKDLCIIDGQHRKASCENLEISVPFIIETEHDDSLKLTQELNSNQKNWQLKDYIKSYVDRNFEDYIRFSEFIKEEEISESLLIWMLYHSRNGVIQDKIKSGELLCTELQLNKVREILGKVKEIRDVIPHKSPQYKNFMKDKVVVPLLTLMDENNYSQSRMVKQMREEYYQLQVDSMSNAGKTFVNIFNKKLSSKNRLPEYK